MLTLVIHHDFNDFPMTPEKVKIKDEMLSPEAKERPSHQKPRLKITFYS